MADVGHTYRSLFKYGRENKKQKRAIELALIISWNRLCRISLEQL